MTPTVLVLGADGFVGRHVRAELSRDHALVSVDVRPVRPLATLLGHVAHPERTYRADLGDPRQIDELFGAVRGELGAAVGVVHLAAHYDFSGRDDARYERLHRAMPVLLERIREHVPLEAPIVYASSMAGIAPTEPGRPLTPASPRTTAWAYPRWKAAAERTLEQADLPHPVVELVLAAVYSDLGELVPLYQQIERIRRGSVEARLYPGSPRRGLTYVHVEDVARAFRLAIERLRGRGGVHRLLVGEEAPVPYRTIHDRASRALHGRVLPLARVPRPLAWLGAVVLAGLARLLRKRRFLRPWMIRYAGEHYELDLRPTREAIGWGPRHHLPDRLDRLLAVAAHHVDLWREVNERRPW